MKKILWILIVGLFFTSAAIASAEEGMEKMGGMGEPGMGMGKQTMDRPGMMGKDGMGMMGPGMMCPLCSSLMKSVGSPQLVSTGDGGFVVLAGNKLIKYDKDLNVVKEAEIKIDVQAMMDKMKDCPMCKMMKEKMQERKEMHMEHREKMMDEKGTSDHETHHPEEGTK